MLNDVLVPDIGDFDNVEIIDILVSVGDKVDIDTSLITLETDKATLDVPSPYAGIVKSICVSKGDKISKGHKILELMIEASSEPSLLSTEKLQSTDTQVSEVNVHENNAQASVLEPNEKHNVEVEVDILLPDLGTTDEVEVIELGISVGDTVEKDATLMTLESDKASLDIPATDSGIILHISVQKGMKVRSFQSVGRMKVQSSTAQAQNPVLSDKVNSQNTPPKENHTKTAGNLALTNSSSNRPNAPTFVSVEQRNAQSQGLVHAGPATRRLATDLGIDLGKIKGSGRKSRVLTTDIHAFVKSLVNQSDNGQLGSGGFSVASMPKVDFAKYGDVDITPLNRIKKLTSENLHRNWVRIPHVTHFDKADITELEAFRKDSQDAAIKMGTKLTPLVFMMKAVVSALQAYPTFNASLASDGAHLVLKKYYHIGVAVDTPNGLVVPVIRDVDKKGLFALAKELGEISDKARKSQLKAEDMQGSCFTISSLGGIGGVGFTPIINAPDVAILGVSKSSIEPVWDGENFIPKLILPLSVSYDHRVIDGAEAARFVKHLCDQLSDIRKLLF